MFPFEIKPLKNPLISTGFRVFPNVSESAIFDLGLFFYALKVQMETIGSKKLTYDEMKDILGVATRGQVAKWLKAMILIQDEDKKFNIDECINRLKQAGREEYAVRLSNFFLYGIESEVTVSKDKKTRKKKIAVKNSKPIDRAPTKEAIKAAERMNNIKDLEDAEGAKNLISYGITKWEAEAFLTTAKARIAHREDLVQSQKLVDTHSMAKEIKKMLMVIKNSFMTVPSKVAPNLKKFKKEAEIEKYLKDTIVNTLEELSETTKTTLEEKLNLEDVNV